MGTVQHIITYTWESKLIDGDAFVAERSSDLPGYTQYGPMPVEMVDKFIAERRAILNDTFNELVARMSDRKRDAVVEAVRDDLLRRSQLGIAKYGTTLSDSPLGLKDYLQHALEESMDLSNYLKGAILQIEAQEGK